MRRPFVALLAVAASIAIGVAALAAPPAASTSLPVGGEPVDVKATRIDVDLGAKSATLDGDVELRRGDLVVRCKHVDARFDAAPRVTWARASGGVTLDASGVRAEADSAELDLAKKTVDLRGGVRVARGGVKLSAERASIDLASHRVSMTEVHGTLPAPSGSAP